MMEWIKKHDVVTKVFSLLVAIVLWMYVIESTDAPGTKRFTNVDIQFQGIETLQENGLTILEGADATVSVEVTGERKKLNQVERDNLMVVVDVSTITGPGDYTRTCMASIYPAVSGLTVSRSPDQIELKIDRIINKSVPVELDIQGTMPEGYVLDTDTLLEPDAVDVQGPEDVLDSIAYAYATVDVSDLRQTSTVKVSYTLMDAAGNPVDMKNIVLPTPSVSVTLTVHKAGEVPLTLDVTMIPGVPESAVSYSIEPSSITIKGSPEILSTINTINLGSVSVATLLEQGETQVTLPLILPNGVTADDVPSEATVTFDFSQLGDKTLTLPATQFLPQDGVTYDTQSLDVRVVGTDSAVAALMPEDLTVSFDSTGLEEGTHTVTAAITCNAADVAVIGRYEITVTKVAS